MADRKEAECCGRVLAHTVAGKPYAHACEPQGQWQSEGRKEEEPEHTYVGPDPFTPPKQDDGGPGPWFTAGYDSECDSCDGAIFAGDQIRADGSGGWECGDHAEADECDHPNGFERGRCPCGVSAPNDDPDHVHSFTWADDGNGHSGSYCACGEPDTAAAKAARTGGITNLLAVAEGIRAGTHTVEPDPWDVPSPPVPELNASGQPAARYEWHGKQNRGYLVKDPATNDFRRYKNGKPKGWTRATTFNKAATDQNSLTDWAKRNVLIGAARRPDLVSKAHGLTHETGKGELMSIVSELETAAGAKVSAQQGTDIHELTERWDAGQLKPEDIPPMYRDTLELYQHALNQAGLRAVPGLIERTTMVQDFGGIVGTLDRVYLHEASGQYVIGDVKTGKTLEYGMDEIETQEWIYAHGINENGVYDWNEDRWNIVAGVKVSEDWGIVIHLPVQGPDAGTCKLVRADLQRGKRHAQVCHDVRVQRSSKPKPELWTGDELKAPEPPAYLWEDAFRCVTDTAHAGALWEKARAAGVEPMELNRLVGLAQQRLRELGVS